MKIAGLSAAVAATWTAGAYTHQTMQASGLVEVGETRLLMGTIVHFTLVGENRTAAARAIAATLDRMAGLESILSHHRAESQLSRLNATGQLDDADPALIDLLATAQKISQQSDGAFDVTVKPLVDLYQRYHGMDLLPPSTAIEQALARVDYTGIHVDGNRVSLAQSGMGVTLDGIAKGFIVDAGVEVLRSNGFGNVLVEAGGDLSAMGSDASAQPWRIGVQAPRARQNGLLAKFDLADRAAATSGDYIQPFSADLRHHHIIDPRTGYSSPELASVTVMAPSAVQADGWATALAVAGVDRSRQILAKLTGLSAYLVTKDGHTVAL